MNNNLDTSLSTEEMSVEQLSEIAAGAVWCGTCSGWDEFIIWIIKGNDPAEFPGRL